VDRRPVVPPARSLIPLRDRSESDNIAGVSLDDTDPSAVGSDNEQCSEDDHCCSCCCNALAESEPTALGRALERLLGITAALCAVALMVGGTVALLRWWL
jgi:hypothetical protein